MNTQTQEALHKALKVLNCLNNDRVYETAWVKGAINACEEALAQQSQEPVAWEHFDKAYHKASISSQSQDWMDAALMAQQARNTHPAPSEPFIGGSVCPSCGNHSLFKTDKSEWCVTHKCLWQSDYPPSWQGLSDDEIEVIISNVRDDYYPWKDGMLFGRVARAIEQALKEKNYGN